MRRHIRSPGPVLKEMDVQAPPPAMAAAAAAVPASSRSALAPAPDALPNVVTVSSKRRLCSTARLQKAATSHLTNYSHVLTKVHSITQPKCSGGTIRKHSLGGKPPLLLSANLPS